MITIKKLEDLYNTIINNDGKSCIAIIQRKKDGYDYTQINYSIRLPNNIIKNYLNTHIVSLKKRYQGRIYIGINMRIDEFVKDPTFNPDRFYMFDLDHIDENIDLSPIYNFFNECGINIIYDIDTISGKHIVFEIKNEDVFDKIKEFKHPIIDRFLYASILYSY